jgi:hypothetical protein
VISDSFVNDQSFLQSLKVNNLKKFNHDALYKTGHKRVTNYLVSQKNSGVGPSVVYATQLAGKFPKSAALKRSYRVNMEEVKRI